LRQIRSCRGSYLEVFEAQGPATWVPSS
jgi:hypothetical protein